MPRLIHLNGPPGIGKSTVARLYADEHPGVLNLDIDELRPLIGGSRSDFGGTGALVRPMAMSMAQTHLSSGRDVIMPQYLGRLSEIEKFAAIAHSGARAFVEIVLMDAKERAIDRFARRSRQAAEPWHTHAAEVVESTGGAALLDSMYDALADVVRQRPNALVLASEEGAPDRTYADMLRALADEPKSRPPRAVAVVVEGDRVLVIKRHLHGRDYAVLPGGGVEPGESSEDAALRELREETTLVAAIERLLWRGRHADREASYYLMTAVRGTPVLSGPEAQEHCADNSFTLVWAGIADFDALNLQPLEMRGHLTDLLGRVGRAS